MRVSIRRTARMCAWSILAGAALVLAGCGLFGNSKPAPNKGPFAGASAPEGRQRSRQELSCPYFSMMGDTQDNVVFNGKGTTIDDLRYHVSLEQMESRCEYSKRNSVLTLSIKVTTTTLIGPAMEKNPEKIKVPIFVVVSQGENRIIKKWVETVEVEPRTGYDRQWLPDLTFDLPGNVDGPELDVLVGFQLTHSQLERNREYR